jgi:hypothetical protein
MNSFTLNATHVTTATVDTLTDHCHGDRELLTSCWMTADPDLATARESVIDMLLDDCNGHDADRLPFVGKALETAIESAVSTIHESDLISDDDDDDRLIWVRLSW